jgi:hypothetical protein
VRAAAADVDELRFLLVYLATADIVDYKQGSAADRNRRGAP